MALQPSHHLCTHQPLRAAQGSQHHQLVDEVRCNITWCGRQKMVAGGHNQIAEASATAHATAAAAAVQGGSNDLAACPGHFCMGNFCRSTATLQGGGYGHHAPQHIGWPKLHTCVPCVQGVLLLMHYEDRWVHFVMPSRCVKWLRSLRKVEFLLNVHGCMQHAHPPASAAPASPPSSSSPPAPAPAAEGEGEGHGLRWWEQRATPSGSAADPYESAQLGA